MAGYTADQGELVWMQSDELALFNDAAYPDSGQSQSSISGLRLSSAIQSAGSTNHFLIVADGSTVTVFANGARLDSVTLKDSLSEGEFAILARSAGFQDPGITSCIFTNTWVWELP